MSLDATSRRSRNTRKPASRSRREPESVADSAWASDGGEGRRPRRAERRAPRPRKDYFFIVLVVLALAKALLSRVLGLGAGNPLGVVLEAAAVILILGAVDLVWHRRSYTVDLTAYTVLSVVMLANVIYVLFFGDIFSPRLLSVVGQASEVQDSIVALIKPVYALYLIDIPILGAWALASWRVRHRRPAPRSKWVALATAVAFVVLAIQIVSALGLSADVDGKAVATAHGFGPYQLASVVRLAMPDPATATAKTFTEQKGLTPAEAAQAQINSLRRANQGTDISGIKFGQYKGKNIIVVQVEALQDFVMNRSYDGQVITPNINKIAAQSWYFPNTYAQVSAGNTVDAEFAVNASLYPPTTGAASVEYASYEIPGLPRLLRAQGYDAVTMHANDARFWNRRELYPALGFRRYWDKSFFQDRDKMWRASDQAFFKYSMQPLRAEQSKNSPFYAFLITMSSHTAFDLVPKARRPVQMSASDYKTLSGLYVGAISYTDGAIGEFVTSLKASGLWDNSIVVFYGDHSANLDHGPKAGDSKVADTILGRPYSEADRERIPLIIHLPGQTEQKVNSEPVAQVDFMPTIAHLVGLDVSKVPHMGRDAFTNAPALIPLRAYMNGGSFVDNTTVFVPGLSFDDGHAYSIATAQQTAPTAQERDEFARSRQLGVLSDAWIKSLPVRPDARGTKGAIIPGQQ